ncbi:60S ribosomal protein L5 [Porphyridium purpureum]|uniref:60S ribosomal protein L5 n=1 Tax=Porphyridium purpureum TaxID=35688 RepID=A0A5J4YXI8_PORPP|nr:60S ribosomal protein L5 [Porphyridium purpureum]|eukprot:POR6309..scf209_3
MAIVKTKAYSKRYQVKPRRRRAGKTDYKARRGLVVQDKRKYNSPKYRFVVRFSNKDICAQVVAATVVGDEVLTSAYAHELPRYGVKLGLTNFAAAYCVGLLCARRLLQKMGLDELYKGKEEADGEMFEIEEDEEKRPFRCLLDVGIVNTTTGHKVFAVMKGAVDGGLDIPHNEKRFPAYTKDDGFDAEVLKQHIFGEHVQEYMNYLEEEDEERYNLQFGRYIKEGIKGDDLPGLYEKAHELIREDPSPKPTEKTRPAEVKEYRQRKISYEERQERLKQRMKDILDA